MKKKKIKHSVNVHLEWVSTLDVIVSKGGTRYRIIRDWEKDACGLEIVLHRLGINGNGRTIDGHDTGSVSSVAVGLTSRRV